MGLTVYVSNNSFRAAIMPASHLGLTTFGEQSRNSQFSNLHPARLHVEKPASKVLEAHYWERRCKD